MLQVCILREKSYIISSLQHLKKGTVPKKTPQFRKSWIFFSLYHSQLLQCCAKSTRRVECPTSLHSLKKTNEQTKCMRASLTLMCVLFFASLINNSGNTCLIRALCNYSLLVLIESHEVDTVIIILNVKTLRHRDVTLFTVLNVGKI